MDNEFEIKDGEKAAEEAVEETVEEVGNDEEFDIPSYTVRPEYRTERPFVENNISYTPEPVKKEKKKKKEKRGLGAAGIALIVILSLIFAAAAGVAGAYLGLKYFDKGNNDSIKTTVVYKDAEKPTPSSDGSTKTYADIHAEVCDSVVSITTEYQTVGFWSYIVSGAGSGVIMSEDGYIITNHHVIRSEESGGYAEKITVILNDGTEYDAEVVGSDENADIAVIKIDATGLKSAVVGDSDKLVVGEEVIAIGNPLGTLSGTMTNGIISALERDITVEDVQMSLLQTNAAINPGNSGGGLFNMDGALIGIVNAKSQGSDIEGLGFAIPVNDAIETATEIIENEGKIKTSKTIIGITTVTINNLSDARKHGVNAYGVYIYEVLEGYNDGVLEEGDRIIAVEESEIASGEDVSKIVKLHDPGDEIEMVIYREGKVLTLKVQCFENTEEDE